MGPIRKSRSVNKRFSYINEISPSKDGDAKKNVQRKRKVADMLGPQWIKEELERFYEAYRKYGKDWKKVAAIVRNRSVDMVEALYTMNRAYLSLPEGTASVVGLIAMMTDHYSNLAESDSERESNDGARTSQKPQKRARLKVHPNSSKGPDGRSPSNAQAVASNDGCLSLLKKRRSGGSRPHAVGKRTPRFPVSFTYENVNGEKYFSPTRLGLKLKSEANDDEVAHEIALALAEASQKGGSPQVSRTPNKRRERIPLSPVRPAERKHGELDMDTKPVGSEMDEDDLEGSMEADNGDLSREKNYLMETDKRGKVVQKGRRLYGNNLEVDDSGSNHLDDIREACSGTEEGQTSGAGRGKFDTEVTGLRSSLQGPRKRSKKVLFGEDEGSSFDALQTLADLSLMMPTTNENDLSMNAKEDNDDGLANNSGRAEVRPETHQREKRKSLGVKTKGLQSVSRSEVASTKISKPGKVSVLNASAVSEATQEPLSYTAKSSKKKQKAVTSKILRGEAHNDTHLCEIQVAEAADVGKKSINKLSFQSVSPNLQKHLERSSSADHRREGSDSALSSVQITVVNQVNLPTKVRSRRKMSLQKPQILREMKLSEKSLKDYPSEKLSNCLLNHRMRRWCAFEWFYSAIDYPWFAKREFVEYLYHVGLGHVPRLTRVEWGVIRSSLGKPRRFSEQFLKEEKEKLNQYRDSVRMHYTELRAGTREGLPTDLARPLSVGQRVIAIHPRTREIHDGSVLTVDHTRCRVQFDRPELGVEFVMDIDCMPSNPLENMPTSLGRQAFSVDKFFENLNELKDQRVEGYMKFSSCENLENSDGPHGSPPTYPTSDLSKQAKGASAAASSQGKIACKETALNQHTAYSQHSMLTQIQAKEADVQALTELTRALDKKEAVVCELRRMNDDVLESQKDSDSSLKDSEPFKKQYAAVLIQLHEANEQVSSALYCLRQRNAYQGNFTLLTRPLTNLADPAALVNSFDLSESHTQESGSHVHEIVESSRAKARSMVDVAVQAMSSLNGGGTTIEKIEEAVDYVNDRLSLDDSGMLGLGSTAADPVHGTLVSQVQLNSGRLNSLPATDSESKNALNKNEVQIPSELITHCVATLLMIQKCTERQFPPADVAQILDSAVKSLQPCSSQNLPVYVEIQKCMGMIRNQILALIPT